MESAQGKSLVPLLNGETDRHREFVAGTRTPLDDETTARLRSLGYVN